MYDDNKKTQWSKEEIRARAEEGQKRREEDIEDYKRKIMKESEGENSGCLSEIVKVLAAIAMLILVPVLAIMFLFRSCSDSGSSSSNNTGYYEYYYDKNDTDGDGKLEGNEADNYFNDIFD